MTTTCIYIYIYIFVCVSVYLCKDMSWPLKCVSLVSKKLSVTHLLLCFSKPVCIFCLKNTKLIFEYLFHRLRSTEIILGKEGKEEQIGVTSVRHLWPLTSWRLCTGRWWVCQFEGHAQWRAWAIEPAQRKREKMLSLYAVVTLNYASCGLGLHGWFICNTADSFFLGWTATATRFTDYVHVLCVKKQWKSNIPKNSKTNRDIYL